MFTARISKMVTVSARIRQIFTRKILYFSSVIVEESIIDRKTTKISFGSAVRHPQKNHPQREKPLF